MNQKGKPTIQNTGEPKIMTDNVYWVNLSSPMHGKGIEIKLLLDFTTNIESFLCFVDILVLIYFFLILLSPPGGTYILEREVCHKNTDYRCEMLIIVRG